MDIIKSVVIISKRAAINAVRIKNQSIIMAVICFAGAFMILFSVLLFNCAFLLKNMTNLPYMDYYLFYKTDKDAVPPEINKSVPLYGDNVVFALDKFEIVDEIISTTRYKQRTNLKYIDTDNRVSDNYGTLVWTVMPNSEYDDSFVTGERILVWGRHTDIKDYKDKSNYIMLDEVLAQANGVAVGSNIQTSDGETFTVIGIFKTVKAERNIKAYSDIPQNLIISSKPPDTGDFISYGTYDVYMKFKDGVSENDKEAFLRYIDTMGFTGEDLLDRYDFISVKELNEINNSGIRTVFNLAVVSIISVFIIITVAIYVFTNIILNSRHKEILLYKALGEKKRNITATLLLETVYIMIPSISSGIAASAVLCRDFIKELFIRFANQMSPESLRSTSSVFVKTTHDVGELVSLYTSAQNLPRFAVGIFITMLFISGIITVVQLAALLKEKTITLLGERKY